MPTNDSGGRSIGGGLGGGGGGLVAGTAATAGGGGRRDGEKTGRSRVFDKEVSGIAHSGLALTARSGAEGTWVGIMGVTTAPGVA
ncbi:hypothetical protein [Bradyrhizobium sp. BR 1432]|uniref:hypothetical protein n=1 Tax=Bradyrhizobium sp. BR 1432 TaxID=3447966 RepID=UPI003EE6916D